MLDLEKLESILKKARRRLSDESEDSDEQDESPTDQGYREFDPDEGDDAEDWLKDNDPNLQTKESNDEGQVAGDVDKDVEQGAETPEAKTEEGSQGDPTQVQAAQEVKGEGRFPQPSREDIAEMRQYTRPWEQRARDKGRLEAEPSKNPVLHHEGKLVEARNAAHKQHQDAYATMQTSPEYKNADPITQMEMDTKFDSDFHKQNPDYLANAAKLHHEAHKQGLESKGAHAAAKDEAIRHVLSGGAQPETPMSTEEGLQHAGGAKGEEGTVGTIAQDP